MHAVTWRTVRCRPRFPAAFVAGQRRPLRNRPFHRTTRALKSDDTSKESEDAETEAQASDPPPKDDNAVPSEDQNQPNPAPTVKLARGVEAAENNAEYLKEQIQAARRIIKRYSSQLSKVNGANQASGIPPVHIPPWFLRLNVALHDEARRDPPYDGVPDIEGSFCINGVSEEQEELLRLALPMPPKLWEALKGAAEEKQDQKENVFSAATLYTGFLSFINKYYRDAEAAKTENVSRWKLNEDLGFHFSLYLEIFTAVAGSLHTKHPEYANSFPAAKSNLVLHCPVDGGIPHLEDLVQDVCAKLQADMVTLGPQDIAELVGEYVGDGSDLASQSLRYLGYQTHRPQFENVAEEEEIEDAEEEEGEESQENTHSIPRPKTNGKRQAFVIHGFPARASFSDLFKAIDGRRRNGPMPAEMLGSGMGGSRPSSPQWDDIKLDASLKALLDAPSTKRTRLSDRTLEPSRSLRTVLSDSKTVESNSSQTEGQDEKLVLGQTRSFRLILDKDLQNVPKIPRPGERKRTVVLVKDYKELSTTQHGGHIIDKLTEIVRKKREHGEEIMIVGITSSAELFPEVSRAGVRRMQAENESDLARTIVVPLGNITIDSLASATDRRNETFTEGENLIGEEFFRVRDINVRHIFDMIGQLDPDALDPVYADETRRHGMYERSKEWFINEGKGIELTGPSLNRRILPFHEVHRLAQTIVGLLEATTNTQHASRLVVQVAILLLRLSDDVKLSWATNERLLESARLSFRTMNAAPKSETQSTLDAVAKSADKTEKKLLPGIVDPKTIKTTFDDVHVPDETKDALKTLISLSMQRPDAFKYGVLANDKMPGLLLYGPPGTGKTLLAKAVAKESGATVLQISASEIYDMWVGESEKNVRAVFSLARKLSPCVVFIDEADSLFGTRAGGKHKAHQKDTLNQFLKEWDGMNDLSVFIMVATNRPFDMDDAVLRRLPRRVLVDLPTEKDRQAILRIHLKGEQLDEALDLQDIAKRTPFYSGSDLKNLCVAAALNCVKEENVVAAKKKEEAAAAAKEAAPTATESSPEAASPAPSQEDASADASASPTPESTEPSPATPSNDSKSPSSSSSSSPSSTPSLYPTRRTLKPHHFDQAFSEIGASISEDMSSLIAIRKFDDQFGDGRNKKKKKSAWGFQTSEWQAGEEAVRVRK